MLLSKLKKHFGIGESIYFIIIALVLSLFITWTSGITTLEGFLQMTGIFTPIYLASIFLPFFFMDKFSLEKATKREIRAEDDILLQATAFSQAALWIYLNLIPSTSFINYLKWIVPSVAVIFYLMRAYAKLKDSNKWRYYSTYALVLIIVTSLSSLLNSIGNGLKGILIIDGVDEMANLFTYGISLIPILAVVKLRQDLKKRYELK